MTNPTSVATQKPEKRLVPLRKKRRGAFALAEQLVAMGIIATVLVASIVAIIRGGYTKL